MIKLYQLFLSITLVTHSNQQSRIFSSEFEYSNVNQQDGMIPSTDFIFIPLESFQNLYLYFSLHQLFANQIRSLLLQRPMHFQSYSYFLRILELNPFYRPFLNIIVRLNCGLKRYCCRFLLNFAFCEVNQLFQLFFPSKQAIVSWKACNLYSDLPAFTLRQL